MAPKDTERMCAVLRELAADGVAVVVSGHEVTALARRRRSRHLVHVGHHVRAW